MNFKTTVILIVLLVVAGITLLFTRDKGGSSEESSEATKVVGIKADEISRIAVTPSSGTKLVLERAGFQWRLAEPVAAPAETFSAQQLADALAGLESRGSVPPSTAGTGVDQPQFKVEITGKSGDVVHLAVGEKSAAGSNLYVKKQGTDKVLVVPAEVYEQLDKPATDFRRKKLVDVAVAEVRRLRISSSGRTISLEKPSTDWQMIAPLQVAAETSAVSDVLTSVGNLQAVEFIAGGGTDAQQYGFAVPELTVDWSSTIATTQPQPSTQPTTQPTTQSASTVVKFGRFDDLRKRNVYVSVDGVIAKVAASSLDALRKSPLDLRDRKVLNVDSAAVSRITLTIDRPAATQPSTRPASSNAVTLTRRKQGSRLGPDLPGTQPATAPTTLPATVSVEPMSNWLVTIDGKESDAVDTKVESLMNRLHPLRAERFVEPTTTVGASDRFRIVIETASGNEELTVYERLDPGGGQNPMGAYSGMLFELGSGWLGDLKTDFTKADSPDASNGTAIPTLP